MIPILKVIGTSGRWNIVYIGNILCKYWYISTVHDIGYYGVHVVSPKGRLYTIRKTRISWIARLLPSRFLSYPKVYRTYFDGGYIRHDVYHPLDSLYPYGNLGADLSITMNILAARIIVVCG